MVKQNNLEKRTAIVIGAGFAGLSAACHLAKEGFSVTILEKNNQAGGRARKFITNGFTFDMGPSWYWMPDVFESFFNSFGKKVSDYYQLERLSPSYRVFFSDNDHVDVPADLDGLYNLFEATEKGAGNKLRDFLKEAAYKYDVGINDLVYKPGESISEFIDKRVLSGVFRLHIFQSFHDYVRKYFSNPKLIQLLEFPVLFLGAQPKDIPALYSLMNYADMSLGTWYPKGGMHKIVEGMVSLAKELGVQIKLSETVSKINTESRRVASVTTDKGSYVCDVLVGGADYHHVEQHLLEKDSRSYTPEYWDKRKLAPSCVIFYLGVNKQLDNLLHHNLFFDTNFDIHSKDIYDKPKWPDNPLFYVSAPSKTDSTVAPEGCENLFILIPVAPGLIDTVEVRESLFEKVIARMEKKTGERIKENIVYRKDYAFTDFVKDYNAFKGNAYGLSNTLWQTANLKPKLKSKKLKNLYFTGQLTVPGPGVPPALISGKVAATQIIKDFN
ncbi:MAG: phytoene desaturase [Bacteroidetes bacterium]|nr:phytoene desaturase [Bacteroidota bacterium]